MPHHDMNLLDTVAAVIKLAALEPGAVECTIDELETLKIKLQISASLTDHDLRVLSEVIDATVRH